MHDSLCAEAHKTTCVQVDITQQSEYDFLLTPTTDRVTDKGGLPSRTDLSSGTREQPKV